MEAKREREEEGRRKEGEERRRSKCIASKNKNPTLRMWGIKCRKLNIYNLLPREFTRNSCRRL